MEFSPLVSVCILEQASKRRRNEEFKWFKSQVAWQQKLQQNLTRFLISAVFSIQMDPFQIKFNPYYMTISNLSLISPYFIKKKNIYSSAENR